MTDDLFRIVNRCRLDSYMVLTHLNDGCCAPLRPPAEMIGTCMQLAFSTALKQASPSLIATHPGVIRLHGPGAPYEGNYSNRTLSGWAGAFSVWSRQGHTIHCYFDNDQAGYAVSNAQQLQTMLNTGPDSG